jgi:membrane fusion protein (multidrug efflux system)
MSEKKKLGAGTVITAAITLPIGVVIGAILGLGMGPLLFALMTGGDMPQMGPPETPPAVVKVLEVEESLLNAPDEYIASVEAVQDVAIRPEVSGKIEQIHFEEGAFVKTGDLLFTIDRSAYQATADAAEAEMNRAKKRYDRLKQADARSVSASDLETAESDYLRGKAAYDLAKVDLDYTEIRAPISGRIGSLMVKKGNVVSPGMGQLTRIVQLSPIHVVFSQTDREYLAMRRRELAGDDAALEAKVLLPDGSEFPTIGKKDFGDNAINPQTGTVAVRYLFDNADGLLLPGGYVTAQVSNVAGAAGIKIPQRALLLDADGAYVLTVDDKATVSVTRVESGDQIGEDVVILSGLKAGDSVITDGVQKAMPGATVQVIE